MLQHGLGLLATSGRLCPPFLVLCPFFHMSPFWTRFLAGLPRGVLVGGGSQGWGSSSFSPLSSAGCSEFGASLVNQLRLAGGALHSGTPWAPGTLGVLVTAGVRWKQRATPCPCCLSGVGGLRCGGRINMRLSNESTRSYLPSMYILLK